MTEDKTEEQAASWAVVRYKAFDVDPDDTGVNAVYDAHHYSREQAEGVMAAWV